LEASTRTDTRLSLRMWLGTCGCLGRRSCGGEGGGGGGGGMGVRTLFPGGEVSPFVN
jgi:hypothetical protein